VTADRPAVMLTGVGKRFDIVSAFARQFGLPTVATRSVNP